MQPDTVPSSGITVTGYGEAAAAPDVLRAVLTIGCDGDDVSAAMRDAAQRSDAVAGAIRELGVGDRDLQTSGMNVRQRRNRDGAVAGYRAMHTLSVGCRDVALGGRLLSAAGDAAGNDLSVDHVGLEIDDADPVLAQAREAAFADARARAEQYAELAGRALGEVRQVIEQSSAGPPAPREGIRMMAAANTADVGVESGENVLGATVTVSWGWA